MWVPILRNKTVDFIVYLKRWDANKNMNYTDVNYTGREVMISKISNNPDKEFQVSGLSYKDMRIHKKVLKKSFIVPEIYDNSTNAIYNKNLY